MVTLYLTGTSIRLESKLQVGEHMLEKYKKFKEEMPKEFCISRTRRGCFAYLNQHYNGSDVVEAATKLEKENERLIEELSTMKTKDEENLNSCVTVLNKQGYNLLADWLHGKLTPVLEIQDVEFEQESAPCCENDKKIEKSAWSEEDEKVINDIMWIIEAYRKNGFNETHMQVADSSEKWIKSLKDRIQPQPRQEWSEEDEEILDKVITNYESGYLPSVEKRDEIIKKLKSLRPKKQKIENES